MNLEKCILRIKVLRLFVIVGAFSSVAVFLIYSLPNNERDSATDLTHGLLSGWPKASHAQLTHGNQMNNEQQEHIFEYHQSLRLIGKQNTEQRDHVIRNKIKRLTSHRLQNDDAVQMVNATKNLPKHSISNVHLFYSLPVQWNQQTTAFYPLLGMYVADNNRTLRHHFKNIELIGANVLIVTWSPTISEQLLLHLFEEAPNFGLRIAIEIDNYSNRTASSIFNDIQYFYKEFWQHEGLYKVFASSKNQTMPMFYIRNVDNLPTNDWKKLLLPNGEMSLRGSEYDAVVVGHIR